VGHGEGHAGAAEDGAVEGGEGGDHHGHGHESSAGVAEDARRRGRRDIVGGGDFDRLQDVEIGQVDAGIEDEHHGDAAHHGARDGAPGVANLASRQGEIVPAVVGPERGDEGGGETTDADRARQALTEVGPGAVAPGEGGHGERRDEKQLEDGEDGLHLAAMTHAKVVDGGNEANHGRAHEMFAGDRAEPSGMEDGLVELRPEETGGAGEAGADGRDRGGADDPEHAPAEQKPEERTEAVANIDVLAARRRPHRAELGVGQSAGQREEAAEHPGQENPADAVHGDDHFPRDEKDAGADEGAHHHGRALEQPERAHQAIGRELEFRRGVAHVVSTLTRYPTAKVVRVPATTNQV